MPLMHNPDSAFAKESVKWESQHTELGAPKRPYKHAQFPMMLHKAGNLPGGGLGIVETRIVGKITYRKDGNADIPIGGVDDQMAREEAYACGFRDTPLEAVEYFEAEQLEFARLHAEREAEKRRMSAKAIAEVDAVEAERGAVHLPTIPEAPAGKTRVTQRDPVDLAKRATEK